MFYQPMLGGGGFAALLLILSPPLYAQSNSSAPNVPPPEIDGANQASPNPATAIASGPAAAEWLEKAFQGTDMPESVRMLAAIARGSKMGPGEGWFGPAPIRYDWKWLTATNGAEGATEISEEQFRGSKRDFGRLDRNQDGRITASDLDWSDRNPYVQQFNLIARLFRRIDKSGMPGRFYVIDSEGKVAYKSGRGPFGFKPGELEQELVMTLLDQQLKAAPVASAVE